MLLQKIIILCISTLILSAADKPFPIWLSSSVVVGQKAQANSDFSEAIGKSNSLLREAFTTSFKKYFVNVTDKINTNEKENTSAVFLTISRATNYEVNDTDSKTTLYSLPVTATINFVNILTGELLYSQVYTRIGQIETTMNNPDIHKKIVQEYQETYRELIDSLAKQASTSFVPKKIQAKIIAKKLGLVIINKGLADGIGEDDGLAGDAGLNLKIKYSAMNYSVAKEILGNASIGSYVSKTYNQSLSDIKKPKVTLLDIDYNHERLSVPPNMMYQFFVDKLAQKGSFTLIPVNNNFWKAINSLQESANLGMKFSKRSSPEYFMRLWIDGPYTYDLPTNVNYAITRNYHMTLCGEIIDTSARVVASSCQNEKIEDKVTFGKAYSKEAQFEVLAKNGAISLAEKFANSVKFEPISYKVTSVNQNKMEIFDEKNLLNIGTTLTIFRDVGAIEGIAHVYIPISKVSVEQKEGNKVVATEIIKVFNGAPSVQANDTIFEDIVTSSNDTSKLFTICDLPNKVGKEEIDGFQKGSQFIVAENIQYPFYNASGLQEIVNKFIQESDFENVPQIRTPKTSYCINPVYILNLLSTKNAEQNGYLENKYNAIIGVKEYQNSDLKNKSGLGGEKTIFPPIQNSNAYLHSNLLEYSLTILSDSMKKLEIK